MEMTLGMSEAEANDIEWRGTDQGTQMKASPRDNRLERHKHQGFSGLTGGRRESDGNFYSGGFNGYWDLLTKSRLLLVGADCWPSTTRMFIAAPATHILGILFDA